MITLYTLNNIHNCKVMQKIKIFFSIPCFDLIYVIKLHYNNFIFEIYIDEIKSMKLDLFNKLKYKYGIFIFSQFKFLVISYSSISY